MTRDTVAAQAQSDLTVAYDDAAGRTPPTAIPADLVGLTLTAGVYKSLSSIALGGALTLDAQGDPNAVFIFQAGSTLITASNSSVNLINGAQPCNVYWQIGSSATLGTASAFVGNILALTSITIENAVTVKGRALARNGQVSLDNDSITAEPCAPPATTPPGGTTPPPVVTPPGGTTPPPVVTPPGGTTSPPATTPPGGTTSPPATTPPGSTTPPVVTPSPFVAPPFVAPPFVAPADPPVPVTGPQNGTVVLGTVPRSVGNTVARFGTTRLVHGKFRAVISGLRIRRVIFSLNGRVIAVRTRAPFSAVVRPGGGTLIARVTFTDSTPKATFRMRFRSTAAAKRTTRSYRPKPGSTSGFAG